MEGATTASVSHLFFKPFRESDVAETRAHDVRHDPRLRHGIDVRRRCVAKAEHAIPTGIMKYCTMRGNDPWTIGRNRHVRIDAVIGIKVHQIMLQRLNRMNFRARQQVAVLLAERLVGGIRALNRSGERAVRVDERSQHVIISVQWSFFPSKSP